MINNKKISVIIPVKNEERGLSDLLSAILDQELVPDEVIVIDAGSEDKTAQIIKDMGLKEKRLKYLLEPGAFPGRGRNVGIAATDADIIVLIDGGFMVSEHWLKPLIMPLFEGKTAHVTGNIKPMKINFNFLGKTFDFGEIISACMFWELRSKKTLAGGASIAFYRSLWEETGGYPEELFNGEDMFFAKKIRALNITHQFAEDSIAYWQVGPKFSDAYNRKIRYARSNMSLDRKMTLSRGIFKRTCCATVLTCLSAFWFPFFYILLAGFGMFCFKRAIRSMGRYSERTTQISSFFSVQLLILMFVLEIALVVGEEIGMFQGLWDRLLGNKILMEEDIND